MSGKLYTPARPPGLPNVLLRVGAMLGLLFVTVLIVYFEGGLRDANRNDQHPDFAGCVYYVLITITTVGYGDIVPETTRARLMDGILLTPIRFLVIFGFFGTAYQLVIQRLQEGYRMSRVVEKLHNHVIVCGYGATGKAAVKELLLQGTAADQIIVLDNSDQALLETTDLNVAFVQGDASSESVLRSVAIERAAHVIICPGRDDAAVLISLTAHALNPAAQIIAACRAQENVKLLQRAGAHDIVSAAGAGGNLMALATRHVHLVNTMRDILTVGGELMIDEREISEDEIGLTPKQIENVAVLRVYRDQRFFDVADMPELALGDKIVYVGKSNQNQQQNGKS
jgi:voltage-gated potassium channel